MGLRRKTHVNDSYEHDTCSCHDRQGQRSVSPSRKVTSGTCRQRQPRLELCQLVAKRISVDRTGHIPLRDMYPKMGNGQDCSQVIL